MPNKKVARKSKAGKAQKQKKQARTESDGYSSDSPLQMTGEHGHFTDSAHQPSTSTANCCCCHVNFPKNSIRNTAFIDQFRVAPTSKNLIQEMIEVERLDELINLKGLQIRPEQQDIGAENLTAYQRLSRIGDEVLEHLVEWTKTLPFYDDFPVEVHSSLLTQRWPELVLLSACFYSICMHDAENIPVSSTAPQSNEIISFNDSSVNLRLLQKRLSAVMHKDIPLDYITKEASPFVESFTALLESFSQLNITLEAYVCLKAITLLHDYIPDYVDDEKCPKVPPAFTRKIVIVQEQFVKALQIHLSQCENGPRMTDIFNWIPILQATSDVLLKSKMFYMPFLICKSPEIFANQPSEQDTSSETESDDNLRGEHV